MPTQMLSRPPAAPSGPTQSRKRAIVGAAAALLVLIVVVLIVRGGSDDQGLTTNTTSTSIGARPGGTGTGTGTDAGSAPADAGATATTLDTVKIPGPSEQIPLDVSVSDTSNLADGDAVSVHVVPKDGSVVYGFEAWLCAGNETYRYDADIRPTLTGKCVANPLSASSDAYKEVRAQPPYTSADTTFRVGVGSDSYRMRDGRDVTVTCGADHPCTLVLKLQFPNGFGFQAIPLTFR
jgi:hypothetical protein